MIVYEYPFNESIRTMLRLEHLFQRLTALIGRETALDHHIALVTLFEIMEVASRADLKSDLLQDLERHRKQLGAWRGNPAISDAALTAALGGVDAAWEDLSKLSGKAGQSLTSNDWLMAIRSRIAIPGGTCSFDLPSYHAWQHGDPARRQTDLRSWMSTLSPLWRALEVSLGLLREAGQAQRLTTNGGRWQQPLGHGKTAQLARVRIEPGADWFPEISGNRLLLSLRAMRADADGHVEPLTDDREFLLTLCT